MQKKIITIPNKAGPNLPDKASYTVYDDNELIVTEGMSNLAHSATTPRGHQFTLYLDFDNQLEPGTYTVLVEVETDSGAYITEFIHVEEDIKAYENTDIITINKELSFDSNYTLYMGNTMLASGFNITIPDHIEPRMDPLYAMTTDQDAYDDIRVWYVNPSIMNAVKDMRSYLDRLNRQLRLDSLEHTDADYLLWLQAGKDRLNTILSTTFTMSDATGSIRDLWLVASQIQCLRTRYLEEGLTSFNYSGAAVQLDVDVTQYLDQLASTLEQRLDNDAIKLRAQLHARQLTSGSGRYVQQSGVASALGITAGLVTTRSIYYR